jgi:hypothetical protein
MLFTGSYMCLFREYHKNHKYRPYYANRDNIQLYIKQGIRPFLQKKCVLPSVSKVGIYER